MSMESPLQKLAPVPLSANELVPHPRAERRRGRGRFELSKNEPDAELSHVDAGESGATHLPVSPLAADEAGSRLDLTA